MTSSRLTGQGVFAALIVAIGAVTVIESLTSGGGGLVRWSGLSVLVPLAAASLLSFTQTLVVAALTLAAAIAVYGFELDQVSVGGRTVVLSLVMISCLISLLVCRVRLNREQRLREVMIARDRLALLSDAASRIGSTLGIVRTTRELANVAVSRFCDFASVDLLETVLMGREPPAGPLVGPVALQRVARQSVLPGSPESALDPGEGELYPPVSLPARCLAESKPVRAAYLDDVDVDGWLATDPHRAALTRQFRIHSAIAVPLCARGMVLGTVMFLRHLRPEPFDDDDLVLAEQIASRAAVCIDNARRYTQERNTSVMLQRRLLPQRLPEHPAVEAASRYLPAGVSIGVGGDWFDLIPLSGARVALVVGDVVGHGLQASANMARLRAAVRTLADIDLPPDELLTHLDDLVIRLGIESTADYDRSAGTATDGSGDLGATCLYAIYDPVSRRCTLARAGHPPPVIVAPGAPAKVLRVPAGPPLGLGGLPFEAVDVDMPEGSLLALYTDGLIESRTQDVDKRLNTLLEILGRPVPDLDQACETVLSSMLDGQPDDDVALLVARTRVLDRDRVASWDLPAEPSAVADARHSVTDQLSAWGYEDTAYVTELMVSELVTNAIRHAQPPLRLRLILEYESLICEVSDGSNTSPHLRRARTFDEDGRGLFIVARLADRWGTRYDRDGKTIWVEQTVAAH